MTGSRGTTPRHRPGQRRSAENHADLRHGCAAAARDGLIRLRLLLYELIGARTPPATRDYVLSLDANGAPLLNVFGGKITTCRRLAEPASAPMAPMAPAVLGHAPSQAALRRGTLWVDGGMMASDWAMQFLPGLLGTSVDRAPCGHRNRRPRRGVPRRDASGANRRG